MSERLQVFYEQSKHVKPLLDPDRGVLEKEWMALADSSDFIGVGR